MKQLKILRCRCGAMNQLSKVRHGPDFYVSYAEIECSKTGFKWVFGKKG